MLLKLCMLKIPDSRSSTVFCLNTNAASIFGEQRKLEPMPPERKARWRKEISWLLSVSDYIVEFVPSQQKSKDGTSMEVIQSLFSF